MYVNGPSKFIIQGLCEFRTSRCARCDARCENHRNLGWELLICTLLLSHLLGDLSLDDEAVGPADVLVVSARAGDRLRQLQLQS